MPSGRSALEHCFRLFLFLAYLLFPTSSAGYVVYQVVAVAADVLSCMILLTGDKCYDVAIGVELRAISAAGVVTLQGCSDDQSHSVTA